MSYVIFAPLDLRCDIVELKITKNLVKYAFYRKTNPLKLL